MENEQQKEEQESIFEEAQKLVLGDRQWAYDHPLDNCTRIGQIWGTILELDKPIEPEKVALMMVGVKMARQIHRHNRDNLVDICGYTECIDMIQKEREQRGVNNKKEWIDPNYSPTG